MSQPVIENLRLKALDLGADKAAVIDTSAISVSEAVAFKCRVPRCPNYASCAHCPPHAPTPRSSAGCWPASARPSSSTSVSRQI